MSEITTPVMPKPAPVAAPFAAANQARPATGWNAFTGDRLLAALAGRYAPWVAGRATALGALAGDAEVQELARLANRHTPELRTHDRFGNRIEWVEFHPAWHQLMGLAVGHEVASLAWTTRERGGHFGRAVLSYLWNQVEQGVACPIGMTYAAWPGLRQPEFAAWRAKIISGAYDPRPLPLAEKRGVTIGYAMTEKQGGSDLRETVTEARFLEDTAEGRVYLLSGHKWFFSVPVSDGFFTLARTASGVSCFFVPGFLPDGSRNRLRLQRLKDKCGNRSNASSEVEYHDTLAWLVGEEGRGIREILSHSHLTRLDFAVGSAGLMRQALTLALNHTDSRKGFGLALSDQPMMTNILADLAVDCEAATLLAFRVARATDGIETDEQERLFARLTTPLAKFWNCRRAAPFVVEALECHGGNGFIEENPMARLYREAPLNAIWEGTSNMMAMDVLRTLRKEPASAEAVMTELEAARGADADYDRWLDGLAGELARPRNDDGHGRRLTALLATALQAAALHADGHPDSFQAFCRSRLAGDRLGWGQVYGTLEDSPEMRAIVERARVA
ncbi:putative acyl-CoA dehydrogenase [Tistlia consotensis]|uniref:Putative acyl-CoA dehydrogenase n=1 Tax=Tistlia consotensis USBA 355 TaxID=560819 RepID=A0A1Y6BBT2_9PROT|nr:acyl-CoA dehydrogenase family protein [Tistlia consotensis]SMF02842.1 putative acyl-CoA dehydrogenase [Tistlia consotensis USBA 355]SNR53138.1 putative acyl-CoA dehydrogenase [Tistlia consotensis]